MTEETVDPKEVVITEAENFTQQETETSDVGIAKENRVNHILLHLSVFIGATCLWAPLITYLVTNGKEESKQVNITAKEVLNFHITLLIAFFVSALLCIVLIGALLLPVVAIGAAVLAILGAVKVNSGEFYKYPVCIRFIK